MARSARTLNCIRMFVMTVVGLIIPFHRFCHNISQRPKGSILLMPRNPLALTFIGVLSELSVSEEEALASALAPLPTQEEEEPCLEKQSDR